MLEYGVQTRKNLMDNYTNNVCYVDTISAREKATQASLPPLIPSGGVKPWTRQAATQTENYNVLPFSSFNDRQTRAFCGVDANIIAFLLFKLGSNLKNSKCISRESKLFLTLTRFKLFIPFAALGGFFAIGESAASTFFRETADALYNIAKENIFWFDKKTIQARMPKAFKALYPNTRAIIDCTEIECQRAPKVRQRVLTYSNYKSRHTVKFLLAIAPSGEVIFVSKVFGGRSTDTEITTNSGFLDLLEEGDVILADKGFPTIERDVNKAGGILVIPPFKSGKLQFTDKQNRDGYEIASVRVHVARAIERLKRFEILNFVTIHMIPHLDKVVTTICFLSNLLPDLIKE